MSGCRLLASEYATNGDLDAQALSQGVSGAAWRALIPPAASSIQRQLRNRKVRLRVVDGGLSVEGLAGVVQLDPEHTLEVCPKVFSPQDDTWREDFLALALAATAGHLLIHPPTTVVPTSDNAIATLLARSFVDEYALNQRRPLRAYRPVVEREFSLDGDVDLQDLVDPSPDGFLQHRLVLTRDNDATQVLAKAAGLLTDVVFEPQTRQSLERVRQRLPAVRRQVRRPPSRLPSRHGAWQGLYDLARQVVSGATGGKYAASRLLAPGYILDTWRAWQELCALLCRLALPGYQIAEQHGVLLGSRDGDALLVRPDVLATPPTGKPLVIDAKYKGRADEASTVGSSDIYETLAFLHAAGTTRAVLIQPATEASLPMDEYRTVGVVRAMGCVIHGVELQVRGLARPDALGLLSGALHRAVDSTLSL